MRVRVCIGEERGGFCGLFFEGFFYSFIGGVVYWLYL